MNKRQKKKFITKGERKRYVKQERVMFFQNTDSGVNIIDTNMRKGRVQKATMYTNCVPVSCSSSLDVDKNPQTDSSQLDICFTGSYTNNINDSMVNKYLMAWKNGLTDETEGVV